MSNFKQDISIRNLQKMKIQTYRLTAFLILCAKAIMLPQIASAHCQIPCGIYDDHARIQSMLEDAATVKKATVQLSELAGKDDIQSTNQTVRWISSKESHSQNVISTISNYFLTQRVKPDQKDYAERLAKHHAVIVAAMKAKQNADGAYADALIESVQALVIYYPKQDHTH